MDNNVKPSTILLIAGGALLFISTLLEWRGFGDGYNGWESDITGLLGIIIALIGLDVAVGGALRQFTEVNLPDEILSFNANQLHLALGFAAFLITFGQITADEVGVGIHLGWISAAVIIAAAIMDMRGAGDDAAAPTQF